MVTGLVINYIYIILCIHVCVPIKPPEGTYMVTGLVINW